MPGALAALHKIHICFDEDRDYEWTVKIFSLSSKICRWKASKAWKVKLGLTLLAYISTNIFYSSWTLSWKAFCIFPRELQISCCSFVGLIMKQFCVTLWQSCWTLLCFSFPSPLRFGQTGQTSACLWHTFDRHHLQLLSGLLCLSRHDTKSLFIRKRMPSCWQWLASLKQKLQQKTGGGSVKVLLNNLQQTKAKAEGRLKCSNEIFSQDKPACGSTFYNSRMSYFYCHYHLQKHIVGQLPWRERLRQVFFYSFFVLAAPRMCHCLFCLMWKLQYVNFATSKFQN